MLKVLINEEEVLTNKDFTIKKEMLNTPSVILNNVYPKTWEDTKDYTSNFYHPQDYSKCKIIDESVVPAEPGETITGTSFTIQDYDNTKLNELTELEGNTTQSGTPTPSSPQPINVVSGRQEVSIVGKNLFTTGTGTSTRIQVEATYNGSEIILNGTTNSSGNIFYDETLSINTGYRKSQVLKAGTYTLTTKTTGTATYPSGVGIAFYIRDNNSNVLKAISSINNYQTTLTLENDTQIYSQFYCNGAGAVYDNYTLQVQIEKGTTPSQYEEYIGQSYEINLGKNLFNKANITSITNGSISGDVITSNPISSNYGGVSSTISGLTLEPGTYYISLKLKRDSGTSGNKLTRITLVGIDVSQITMVDNPNITNEYQIYSCRISPTTQITLTNIGIQLQPTNVNAVMSYTDIMVSKDSDKTYAPYKTPIELCKIGTYQDKIYKDNGTWYLEKQIKKVVYSSSQIIDMNWLNYQNLTYFRIPKDQDSIDYNNYNSSNALFNKYVNTNEQLGWDNANYIGKITSRANLIYYWIGVDKNTDLATYRTQINSIEAYVPLATPTITEITDTELISQLNAIELLEGLNNVSVSSADLPGEITIHYNYTEEQTIDDLLFCGVVKNSGNISLNPREPHFQSLQILDFKTFLSEGELDSFVIYQKTILEAIQMVIANIQDYGFILGNVNILNPTDVIGAYSTKDKTAYDVFNYIADITQSRWTTRLIDENHVAIDFYDPTLMIEGTPINYTQAFFENNLIDDMTYSYGSNNYRNKQVMTSSQVYSNISQQQSIVANGYQTQFPTEQPIGKINSITSNGIPLTFATFNEKEMGYVADFYYSPGDNYFESEDLRSTGEILIIDYVAIVEGRQIITNPLEIDRINDSTGRKGIISRYEQRNDATTSTELQKIGESYIKYKGTPEIKLKISTRKNIWEVGQRVQFNAPIEELDTEYMVRTKKINYISTIDTIFYEYELISSFNSETEINYFDNQRAKASGNIGEGEYISRNIDIESTANIIFYDTETTEVQVDGDNVLNSILNSPFTS